MIKILPGVILFRLFFFFSFFFSFFVVVLCVFLTLPICWVENFTPNVGQTFQGQTWFETDGPAREFQNS